VELRSNNFVTHVRDILKETGLEPQYLEFELTEAAFFWTKALPDREPLSRWP
jgi:EAL domain-containing protein (putative c-di-GMP-specific phosphodiesterase class I)